MTKLDHVDKLFVRLSKITGEDPTQIRDSIIISNNNLADSSRLSALLITCHDYVSYICNTNNGIMDWADRIIKKKPTPEVVFPKLCNDLEKLDLIKYKDSMDGPAIYSIIVGWMKEKGFIGENYEL